MLTGASGGRRRRADGSPAGFGGGNGAVAVDGVVRGSSGTADSPGRHKWTLRRWYRGQRSSEVDGGGELCGRRVSPEMASGLNPASAPAEIASRDLEESPGVGAKLGRSSGGAWAWRSGGAAAAQATLRGGAARTWLTRVRRWRRWGRWDVGGSRGATYRAAGNLGVRAQGNPPRYSR